MFLISDDLKSSDPKVKEAVLNLNVEFFKKINDIAQEEGFNYLEIDMTDMENEKDALLFISNCLKESSLNFLIKSDNLNVIEEVLPNLSHTGIVNPKTLDSDSYLRLFKLIKNLGDSWDVLFTQTFGNKSVSEQVEGLKNLIAQAREEGIEAEKLLISPLTHPLKENNEAFYDMKRVKDAFTNIYDDINTYISLPFAAEGLNEEDVLMDAFIVLCVEVGIDALSFSVYHTNHLETLRAANAILNNSSSINQYLENQPSE